MIATEAGDKAVKSLLSLRKRRTPAIVPGSVWLGPEIAAGQDLSRPGETLSPH